jgi:KUP system potassium uptake protein
MRQASMLGLFPKTTVIHTGHHVEGQIYMPEVNYALMVLCVVVTAGFQSTKSLGEAYGESCSRVQGTVCDVYHE